MSVLAAANRDLFFTRNDSLDPRMGEIVTAGELNKIVPTSWNIVGYPDDEGIFLNGGRVGAALAPSEIRRFLYRMTPPLLGAIPKIQDLGDLKVLAMKLPERHQAARSVAEQVFKAGGNYIALGGGHDYGFADSSAFAKVFAGQSPLVINFDAHLDVRPTDKGFHSGTPFRRLLEEFPKTQFLEIGIQSQCNARDHYNWLKKQGGQILTLSEMATSGDSQMKAMTQFILPHLSTPRPVFLSIDLDAFSSAFAPGCSQSWPTGLAPLDVIGVLEFISRRVQVKGVGLYEVSPPLDIDGRTSRLAALLIHSLVSVEVKA